MIETKERIKLPMMALRGLTVFPNMAISFPVGRQKSLDALEVADEGDKRIFLVAQRDPEDASPEQMGLYEFGTVATIKQILKLPGNMTHVIVEGVIRGRLETVQHKRKCDYAEITTIAQDFPELPEVHTAAEMRIAQDLYEEYAKFVPNTTAVDLLPNVLASGKPGKLADVIAAGLEISFDRKQRILEILNPYDRLQAVMEIMRYEQQVLRVKREIEAKTKDAIDKNQREYFLREELKVIQEELGDKDGIGADAAEFRRRLEEKNPPEEVRKTVEKEIDRMMKIPVTSPESNVSRSYIDTLLNLPWNEMTEETFDLKQAAEILDEDHYGLEKVISGGAEKRPRGKSHHPLFGGPSRCRQNIHCPFCGKGIEPEICAYVFGRRERRSGNPRPPQNIHRRHARPYHECHETGGHHQSFDAAG